MTTSLAVSPVHALLADTRILSSSLDLAGGLGAHSQVHNLAKVSSAVRRCPPSLQLRAVWRALRGMT